MRLTLMAFLVMLAGVQPAVPAVQDGKPPASLRPERVGWTSARLEAHKLFVTATTAAEWSIGDAGGLAGRLLASPQGTAIQAGPRVLELRYRAELPGIRSATTLWMDPETGNSLQYEIRDSGKRTRERVVRFTDAGAFQRTRRPRAGEEAANPAKWTDESSGFWPYAERLPGTTVLDSLSLLYFIAAADLTQTGDEVDVLIFQSRELVRVGLAVDRQDRITVNYRAEGTEGVRTCKGPAPALRIRLTVRPYGAGKTDFDFLGLKSDIVVYVEPSSRLPLRIEGQAAIVGKVTSNLKRARLQGGTRCPGMA